MLDTIGSLNLQSEAKQMQSNAKRGKAMQSKANA
jgi:hypothetical protein